MAYQDWPSGMPARRAPDAERLARAVAEPSTAALVKDDVHAMLARLCGVAVDSLGCRAAGVHLVDERGTLRLAAASDELTFRAATRDPSGSTPLGAWAAPLRAGDLHMGILDLRPSAAGAPSQAERRVAQALADIAGGVVWRLRRQAEDRRQAQQLQHALDSRIVIEQAEGALCAHLGSASTRPSGSCASAPGTAARACTTWPSASSPARSSSTANGSPRPTRASSGCAATKPPRRRTAGREAPTT